MFSLKTEMQLTGIDLEFLRVDNESLGEQVTSLSRWRM